jgi:hypothetical protein
MGTTRPSAEMRPEDDGSDSSNESIRLRDRPAYDRSASRPPSGRSRLQRPQHPDSMQHPTRHDFVHRWRESSSSDLNLGSPLYTPGTETPMSLVTPSATWLPENRNSSLSVSPGQFATPLVCSCPSFGVDRITDWCLFLISEVKSHYGLYTQMLPKAFSRKTG